MESLIKAYKIVEDKFVAVKKAARMYGVQTFIDRVLGKVYHIKSGNETLFSREEDRKLDKHLNPRANLEHG